MSKKGVSKDEKRSRMLQLFYEKKDFYQLKDLEKIAPKEKGIVAQSVKEVLTNLVDDGLVDSEKIGTSIYYWAFPSKALNLKKKQLSTLSGKVDKLKNELEALEEKLSQAKAGKDETPERLALIKENNCLKEENKVLLDRWSKFDVNSTEDYEKYTKEKVIGKDAANRWTDNIFTTKSWCKKKFMIEENVLNKQFGISEDMDYL